MIKLNSKAIEKIGVVIADDMEFHPFVEHFQNFKSENFSCGGFDAFRFVFGDLTVTALRCGIGKVNAAAAAATLIHLCGCEMLLNEGLSGGVQLSRAAIVISTRFVEHDFDLTALGYPLGKKPNEELFIDADGELSEAAQSIDPAAVSGTLGTGDSFISDEKTSNLFAESFDELACDMESAAIASVAKRNGVPFVAIRKISDSANEKAIDDYNEMNDKKEKDLALFIEQLLEKLNCS